MEHYYTDRRVSQALEKSIELMDISKFRKQIDFEIQDNLGFDVLWDSLSGKRYTHVGISVLKWMGYEGSNFKIKQNFMDLLTRNGIKYSELGFGNPILQEFSEIQKEMENTRPIDKPRKRWLIMDTRNFKEAIMSLTTKRSKGIRKYYLQLEELVQLYGAYTHKFQEIQLKIKLEQENNKLKEQIKANEDHILFLKDLLADDQKQAFDKTVSKWTARKRWFPEVKMEEFFSIKV